MDGRIMHHRTTSSCQSAATSKIVNRSCSRVFSCKQCYSKYSPKPPIVNVLTLSFAGQNVAATMTDLPLFDELWDNADEQLFDNVRRNSHHTLHHLLPPESLASQNYSLRSRAHNRQLPEHFNHLDDSNFIIRMLYKNMY